MSQVRTTLSTQELREQVARLPRFPLAHLPTPLEHLPRFSEALGGPQVWIKRDDCTGLAFGGNKTRHNEFLIADALGKGARMIVWGAGVQSNNCRQTAAACAKAGLDCHPILGRGRPADGPDPVQGNLLLDHLVGASIEIVDESVGPQVDEKIAEAAARFRDAGHMVYELDHHTVRPLAAVSYVLCLVEIVEQAESAEFGVSAVYGCSAGSTGSGLSLARAALGASFPIWHITPLVGPHTPDDMAHIANEAAELIDVDVRLDAEDLHVSQEYVGSAYGAVTAGCLEAIALLARTEGVLVDPTYSGKALAGLIDHIRSGRLGGPDENVVFVHTGGTPALFAYNEVLAREIERRTL